LEGLINVNKPGGFTSFQVVSRIRKMTGGMKTGHAGTLDPFAEGVLPVMIGQATRLAEYFLQLPKTYRAEILFGRQTDTLDITGSTTHIGDYRHINTEDIRLALKKFVGQIYQTPPFFSAVQVGGRRLYHVARNGGPEPDIPARKVSIYKLVLLDYSPPVVRLEISCGRGTYIRSLARDLGKSLETRGCLQGLVRTVYGPFKLEQSVRPEELEKAAATDRFDSYVQPMDMVLAHIPRMTIGPEREKMICTGAGIGRAETPSDGQLFRAYNTHGELVALVAADNDHIKPKKVFKTWQVS
jgi:tRNA pseudouridine55 synthase